VIPNLWYAVLDSSEVKRGRPAGFRRMGKDLVFWRDGSDRVVAMHDRCPHRSAKLSLGKIVDGNIQCPFHGFQFNSAGTVELVPANGRNGPRPSVFRCGTLPAQEAHGFVWLWNGEPHQKYPPLPWFDDLEGFTYSTFQVHWDTDYTRALEGLLDVSHLPFVHAKTIGRGNATLVNGPYTTLENGRIRVWISNQPDAGLPATKPTELPHPGSPPSLSLNFPNLWQLRLSEKMRVVNVAAPVDDENVVIYSRTYQGITRFAPLGKVITRLSNVFNRMVLNEDYHIARSQRPKKSGLQIGEHFIPADRPIALYLQHRRQRMESSAGEVGIKPAQTDISPSNEAAIDPKRSRAYQPGMDNSMSNHVPGSL
jgi:phenylpropionate dioxygenase-like ring-hydroxylating dioxygenase large terminal subunit